MLACARTYLTCRGKDSGFYAQNLCTLAVLSEPKVTVDQLFIIFLESRSKWMDTSYKSSSSSAKGSLPFSQQERHLTVVLRSMNLTLLQTEEIFDAASKFSALEPAFQLQPALREQLNAFISSGALERMMTEWFVVQHKKVRLTTLVDMIIGQMS